MPLRGRPTQRAVLAELRRVILAGDVPPGSAIPLDDVAVALGMSVIPVRESLKILIGEGLVEQHARGAYTVARLTRSELRSRCRPRTRRTSRTEPRPHSARRTSLACPMSSSNTINR